MKKKLYSFIFFKILKWKFDGSFNPEINKCILAMMPHTSNFDFIISLLIRGIANQEMNFVGKKELFVFPFGYYFKAIGGEPLDRSGGKNLVDAIVEIFDKKEVFRLAIAPEGTRKKVTQLRSGFYYIALKANVPIIPIAFDYNTKTVKIGNPIYPNGSFENDIKIYLKFYENVIGKNKDLQFF